MLFYGVELSQGSVIQNLVVERGPSNPLDVDLTTKGRLFFNTTLSSLLVWTGGAWVSSNSTDSAVFSFNDRVGNIAFLDSDLEDLINTRGRHIVSFTPGNGKILSDFTGLNGATTYTATITVDGTVNNISILGSLATTYTELFDELNTLLVGVCTISFNPDGNIRVISDSRGSLSSVNIGTNTLFTSLTDFDSTLTPILGVSNRQIPLPKATLSVLGGVKVGAGLTVDVNGVLSAASTAADLPTGTRMLFAQAAAPTGWIQDVTDVANNRMLRVVNTAGNGVGGVDSPFLMNKVPPHSHTINPSIVSTSSAGAHTHTYTDMSMFVSGSGDHGDGGQGGYRTATTSAAAAHTHTVDIPSTTSAVNTGADTWQPRYLNVIVCRKV